MRAGRSLPAAAALAAASGLAAGCGGASHHAAKPLPSRNGAKLSATQRARFAAIHAQVTRSLKQVGHDRYGGLPSYLPKPRYDRINRVKTATPHHAVLAIEGDAVSIVLSGSTARASAIGPYIPAKEQTSFSLHSPAHFNVLLQNVRGRFPLSPDTWTITDEQGVTHHPTVAATKPQPGDPRGSRRIVLTTGHLSIGDGRIRYAPAGRDAVPVVQWDFDNETD